MRVIWDIYTVLFAIFKKASNVDIKSGVTLKISHIETSNLVTYLYCTVEALMINLS